MFAVVATACVVSCKKEGAAGVVSLPAGPKDTVTDFYVNFYNTTDSSIEVGAYADPDGPGPLDATIGGVSL